MALVESGPWLTRETALSVRKLHAWSNDQKLETARKFESLLVQWQRDWSLSNQQSGAVQAPASHSWVGGETAGIPWKFSAMAQCHFQDSDRDPQDASLICTKALQISFFGASLEESAAPAAAQISKDAWSDWSERLTTLVKPEQSQSSENIRSIQWAGILRIRLPWCGGFFTLDLGADQVTHLLPPRTSDRSRASLSRKRTELVSIRTVIGQKPHRLEAQLTPIVLTVGALCSLSVGDVVTLEHKLDSPLLVSSHGKHAVAQGWLGKSDKNKALQLDLLELELKENNS